jgi:hypothetical protein
MEISSEHNSSRSEDCAGRRWWLLLEMALAVELADCTLVQKF